MSMVTARAHSTQHPAPSDTKSARPVPREASPLGTTVFMQRHLGNRHFQQVGAVSAPCLQRACACGGTCANCAGRKEEERLQTKLTVGPPGDRYEREADHVADRVMLLPEPHVQRQAPVEEESEEEVLQTKPLAARITPLVQREVKGGSPPPTPAALPMSGARPLSAATRAFMEPRFGVDFGGVRLHTGAAAEQAASRLNARAFTYGRDVWLGRGEGESDRRLVAHELTHVVQQRSSMPPQQGTMIQRDEEDETWTPPTSGVVQSWMYNQIDNWHTGATQALSSFKDTIREDSSVGFWLGLAGNVIWATGAIFPPAGAVATGLVGVAIATVGGKVQEHRAQAEYERVQDIYEDLLEGFNDARSAMDRRVIPQADRVMAMDTFQAAVSQRDTAAWQEVVRTETGLPQADDVQAVRTNMERSLYNRYLKARGAWVSLDVFNVPSPHHPGLTSERRNFQTHRVPERVRSRLERLGVDWHRIDELPVPHRERELYRREGTVGAIEYWNYEEDTIFPRSWTPEERRAFLEDAPSYLSESRSGVTH